MSFRLACAALLLLGACTPASPPTPAPPSASPAPAVPPSPAPSAASAASAAPQAFACKPVPPLAKQTPPTPVTPEASKETKATCARLERDSARAAARRKARGQEGEEQRARVMENLGRCIVDPGGAWLFEVREARHGKGKSYREVAPDEETFAFAWELVHIDSGGKIVRGNIRGTSERTGSLSETIRLDGVHDLDGDGVAELFYTLNHSNTDEEHSEKRLVMRAKGGKLEPYPGTGGMTLEGLEDVDGDGRVDLVLQSTFRGEGPCGLDGQRFHGPRLLAHTLPGGAFSGDDAVARAFVRAQCGADPTLSLLAQGDPGATGGEPEPGQSVHRIACAVMWGLPAEQIERRVRGEYPRGEAGSKEQGRCVPLEMLLGVARTKPPFVLDGCPGR